MAAGHPLIRVTSPAPGDRVTSPLAVQGEARGPWYFEATFPLRLVDAQGRTIVTGYAQAQGEWMTTEFVPFSGRLEFAAAPGGGWLVLEKNNASGLPEHADSLTIPVRF